MNPARNLKRPDRRGGGKKLGSYDGILRIKRLPARVFALAVLLRRPGKFDDQGFLYIVGRKKEMIKSARDCV